MSPTQSEIESEIERMQAEVKRQEESGQFNTASHEVLANLKKSAGKMVLPKPTKLDTNE